jgi:ubiquinone/menaquinone biosynthesis C-methylase UbiE
MNSSANAVKVTWDYTEHASHYDKRADYSQDAIDELLRATGCSPATAVAEVGAGTGKLTKELLKRGLTVRSVEPNDAMRAIGIKNTAGQPVTWSVGTGERTGLQSDSAHALFFGSSFNVVDQAQTLIEVARVLNSRGWFGCMWNHRDLNDPIQQNIESIIKSSIAGYSYGSRREDPTAVVASSKLFGATTVIERTFQWPMPSADIIVAWRSHATLKRQAGTDTAFAAIIDKIAKYLDSLPATINVPYTTRIYYAQKLS